MVALPLGGRANAGQVAAGVGFGHGDGQDDLAADALGQPASFLLLVAEFQQIRHDDVVLQVEGHARGADPGQFLVQNHVVAKVGQPAAAIFLGHVHAQQSLLAGFAPQVAGALGRRLPIGHGAARSRSCKTAGPLRETCGVRAQATRGLSWGLEVGGWRLEFQDWWLGRESVGGQLGSVCHVLPNPRRPILQPPLVPDGPFACLIRRPWLVAAANKPSDNRAAEVFNSTWPNRRRVRRTACYALESVP